VPSDHLSITFAALADPTRRSILTRLAEGEATVNELAEPFSVSLPAISRHLKVLEHAGLIVRSREAQWRPSRLQADPLDEAVEWMLSRKATWEARMDRLETHLRRTGEQHELPDPRGSRRSADPDHPHLRRAPRAGV
jgi:DNA-binding transcriptional ArsR family regulator